MKVLLNSINYWPDLTGVGKYTGEMAEWLSRSGHDVRVVTAPPYYPGWRIREGFRAWRYESRRHGDIRVIRCPLWVPREPTGLKRVAHLMSFALASGPVVMWHAMISRPDIVLVTAPALFCAPLALIAARLGGSVAWLHVQDFELDAAFDLGLTRSLVLRKLATTVERWIMRGFDRVSTISPPMLARLEAKGVPASKGMLFPNWVDPEAIRPLEGDSPFRKELGIGPEAVVCLYAGNMGEKQGLELLVDSARRLLKARQMVLILAGEGSARGWLQREAEGLANVKFMPLQPVGRFNELLNLADIHLLPQRADVEDLVMPSKLSAMMASGKPVVATARPESEVAKIVARCGVVITPGDVRAFSDALLELGKDPQRRAELGASGRDYAKKYWEVNLVLSRAFGPETIGLPAMES